MVGEAVKSEKYIRRVKWDADRAGMHTQGRGNGSLYREWEQCNSAKCRDDLGSREAQPSRRDDGIEKGW